MRSTCRLVALSSTAWACLFAAACQSVSGDLPVSDDGGLACENAPTLTDEVIVVEGPPLFEGPQPEFTAAAEPAFVEPMFRPAPAKKCREWKSAHGTELFSRRGKSAEKCAFGSELLRREADLHPCSDFGAERLRRPLAGHHAGYGTELLARQKTCHPETYGTELLRRDRQGHHPGYGPQLIKRPLHRKPRYEDKSVCLGDCQLNACASGCGFWDELADQLPTFGWGEETPVAEPVVEVVPLVEEGPELPTVIEVIE